MRLQILGYVFIEKIFNGEDPNPFLCELLVRNGHNMQTRLDTAMQLS